MSWTHGHQRDFKFDPTSTAKEGHFRLHNPGKLHTFYRRKTSDKGVSELIGHDGIRKVVASMVFDKKIMPEHEAARWWDNNGYNYHQAGESND